MTARATLTQSQIARAIRAADACGKVAFIMPGGIALVDPALVALPSPEPVEPAPFDAWKAKREARRERLA
jgi:hypothetical protein